MPPKGNLQPMEMENGINNTTNPNSGNKTSNQNLAIEMTAKAATSSEKYTATKPQLSRQRSSSQLSLDSPIGRLWWVICFGGIVTSFGAYGIVMEYATSGGRKLHELSFIFFTSALYVVVGYVGRHVRQEKPTTVKPYKLMMLALMAMGSTFCSVRSLRYVIFPVQVLAKSCKPIPVMFMGALMGKSYPLKKYANVALMSVGVAMFLMGKSKSSSSGSDSAAGSIFGVLLLFISLCFDGAVGAYEDKLMAEYHIGPFDLMYNLYLGKFIVSGFLLIVLGEISYFVRLCHEQGFLLLVLGFTGSIGQVFIFVTIGMFGALQSSLMGLVRKMVTLTASVYIYGHSLNGVQSMGLVVSFSAMISNFMEKKKGGHGHGGHGGHEGDHGPRKGTTKGSGKDGGTYSDVKEEEETRRQSQPLLAPENEIDEEKDDPNIIRV